MIVKLLHFKACEVVEMEKLIIVRDSLMVSCFSPSNGYFIMSIL